jgi:hypothetical protein
MFYFHWRRSTRIIELRFTFYLLRYVYQSQWASMHFILCNIYIPVTFSNYAFYLLSYICHTQQVCILFTVIYMYMSHWASDIFYCDRTKAAVVHLFDTCTDHMRVSIAHVPMHKNTNTTLCHVKVCILIYCYYTQFRLSRNLCNQSCHQGRPLIGALCGRIQCMPTWALSAKGYTSLLHAAQYPAWISFLIGTHVMWFLFTIQRNLNYTTRQQA